LRRDHGTSLADSGRRRTAPLQSCTGTATNPISRRMK
jgi:hypothetical protein